MLSFKHLLIILILTLASDFLSGCLVGPNFQKPQGPSIKRYTEVPLPQKTVATRAAGRGGKAQEYIEGRDIPAEWWHLFRSPQIDELIRTGLVNSPNLSAAQAALRQAQETLNAQIGNLLFPAFDAALSGERERFQGSTFGGSVSSSLFNIFNATVTGSYNLDIYINSNFTI